ncbi:MAG: LamG domain-containing protein, partial [Nitrosotalea sp.]
MPKVFGETTNATSDLSGVINETLTWKFYDLNPDKITFENTMRVVGGPSGHSLKFNGHGDYVGVESSANSQVKNLMVSAWIKPDYNNTLDKFVIVSKNESFSLYLKSYGKSYHADFSIFDGKGWYTVESKTWINPQWTHLTGLFDGESLGIYINDTLDSSENVPSSNLNNVSTTGINFSSGDIVIGASGNDDDVDSFSGLIDNVEVNPSMGYGFAGTLVNRTNALGSSNMTSTMPSNATSSLHNMTSTLPSNSTIFHHTFHNMTSTMPSNVTSALPNMTSTLPSNVTSAFLYNVTKPLYHFGFDPNSILPQNFFHNATIADNGINGTALKLVGNGYVSLPLEGTNQISNFTLLAWVKPDYSAGHHDYTLLSKQKSFLFMIHNTSNLQGIASFSVYDGMTWHTVESKSRIPQAWTNLAATFDGTSISIFVNGIREDSTPISEVSISASGQIESSQVENFTSTSNVLIGATLESQGQVTHQFVGLIDELSIYNSYLDDSEIHYMFDSLLKYANLNTHPLLPLILPLNSTQIPKPDAYLNFNSTTQNGTKTFGDAQITSSGVNSSSLELSGHGFVSKNITSTNNISNFTLSTWVNPVYQEGSAEYAVLSKEGTFLLTIHNNIPPKKIASFSIYDGITWHTVESKSEIPETWTHLAATFNGTAISIYVNGVLEDSVPVNAIGISISGQLETKTIQNMQSPADVIIGAQESTRRGTTSIQSMFGGQIEEVSVYKSSLTPQQIQQIYLKNAIALNTAQIPINATVHLSANAAEQLSINATVQLLTNTIAQSLITPSIHDHKTSFLMTEKPEFDFEFISKDTLKKLGQPTKESFGATQVGNWTDNNSTMSVTVVDPDGN